MWTMRTILPKVPVASPRLHRLGGTFQLKLIEQSDPVEIGNVLGVRNVLRRVGRQAIQLVEVTKVNEAFHVKVIVSRNGLSEQEWRGSRELNGIQLFDAKGRPLARGSFDTQEDGDQVTYDITFVGGGDPDGPGLPAKLVCQLPLEEREVTVPFEFIDLPVQTR